MNGGEGLYLFPNGSYTLGKAPYMEASIGIENIFKFLRLDYVWRLNYRDHPGIQTKGVRFMMILCFFRHGFHGQLFSFRGGFRVIHA